MTDLERLCLAGPQARQALHTEKRTVEVGRYRGEDVDQLRGRPPKKLGVTPRYLAGIERGERNLTLDSVDSLARQLTVPTRDLLTEDSPNI